MDLHTWTLLMILFGMGLGVSTYQLLDTIFNSKKKRLKLKLWYDTGYNDALRKEEIIYPDEKQEGV